MATSVESIFHELLIAALSEDCGDPETLPPPPYLPSTGFVPYEPNGEIPEACSNPAKKPSDYGLPIQDWNKLNLFDVKVLVRDEKEPRYNLILTKTNAQWFFDAKERMPKIKGALEKVIVELAFLRSAVLIKEKLAAGGYELPDVKDADKKLRTAISAGQKFILAFNAYKLSLEKQLKDLQEAIRKESESLK